ncbi:VCBS repeat-containing protein [Pendulispora rubella]|uniref:VCBS repeat-containing protein n=1 Tax=Pendulispora rubella TaxID=2741070 RepID=A0ABZ2L422_9BACT
MKATGAAWRILVSFGVIVAVLAVAIFVAKLIQSNTDKPAQADAAVDAMTVPDASSESEIDADVEDAGTDAARAESLCETIAKEIEATASRKLGAEMGDASGWLLPDLFRDAHCVAAHTRSGTGIWAMVPTGVRTKDASAEVEVLWDVVHISGKGDRVTLAQPPFVSSVDRSLDLEQPTVFDYDGDGQDEVILTGASWVRDGVSQPYARLWTIKGKKIDAYSSGGTAPEFGAVEDIDDDGRPDLLTNGVYTAEAPDAPDAAGCGAPEHRLAGPLLALHSRADGTFSASDEVAFAYAKKACPARPKSLLVKDVPADASAQPASSLDNLVCARLWGVSEADVTAMIAKECRVPRPADAGVLDAGKDAGKAAPCSGEILCDDAARFRPWLRAKPPLSLR